MIALPILFDGCRMSDEQDSETSSCCCPIMSWLRKVKEFVQDPKGTGKTNCSKENGETYYKVLSVHCEPGKSRWVHNSFVYSVCGDAL